MIANMKLNWRTTAAGFGILLATLGNAISQYAQGGFAAVDLKVLVMGISAAFAAFAAKDGAVSGLPATQPTP